MSHENTTAYQDGGILCDGRGLTIRRYYPWGAKRIPYTSIRGVERLPLTGASKVRRWRIWGSGDFVHWWNLDTHRPGKDLALVIDVGHHVRPTITPDDPDAVERILAGHITGKGSDRPTGDRLGPGCGRRAGRHSSSGGPDPAQ